MGAAFRPRPQPSLTQQTYPILLVGKALVRSLLLGRALGLLGHPLDLLLCFLGFLLHRIDEVVPSLSHRLVFLSTLRDGKPYCCSCPYGYSSHGEGVLPYHALEAPACAPSLVASLAC